LDIGIWGLFYEVKFMTQEDALKILKMGHNVFLTGEPGSGKTHIVNEYVDYLRAHGIEPAITASTGISATHIGGLTIHSWAGIGIKQELDARELKKIATTNYITKRVKRAKVLIIDEISMLSSKTFSVVDAVCKAIKDSDEPFGGMQVVLVGDFFQLPPIVKSAPKEPESQMSLMKEPDGRFAYDSQAWKKAKLITCYLTEQHRQDDPHFLDVLSAIRKDTFDARHLQQIEARKIDYETAPATAPKLFSYNMDVDRVNNEILGQLKGEEKSFGMFSQGPEPLVLALKKGCLSPESLSLKIGASVMFTKNNVKEGFVNGTLGVVEDFAKETHEPIIKTRDGRKINVEMMDWVIEEDGKVRAKVSQLPLRLAWAITVHKSQGMSLDEAVMDLGSVFEYGQGYVALSRVRRFSGLHLLGFNDHAFKVNPEVLKKDLEFQRESNESVGELAKISAEKLKEKNEKFILNCGGRVLDAGHTAGRPTSVSEKTYSVKKIREKIKSAYLPWNKEQDEELEKLFKNDFSVGDLAIAFNRTKGSILARLKKLQILEG